MHIIKLCVYNTHTLYYFMFEDDALRKHLCVSPKNIKA